MLMRLLKSDGLLALLCAGFVVSGCSKRAVLALPSAPVAYQGIVGDDRLQDSLFKGDQEVLSNADIERILGARVVLDDRHSWPPSEPDPPRMKLVSPLDSVEFLFRLAILSLGPRLAWSQELSDLDAQNSERFLKTLGASAQLTQVRLMPTLLIPERRTVPYLREAAARFQADLLLVYTTRVQTFQQGRLIGPDEVRADCGAESVLLDVRTGIVVHTARTSENLTARKMPGDLNFSETVAKAQLEATGRAINKLAEAVVAYLKEGK